MDFENRYQAGALLAEKLQQYKNEKVVVFGLPRGGVVTASAISDALEAPLDLIIAHKIGHPLQPEYAIGAIAEGGYVVENKAEVAKVDPAWYEGAKQKEIQEIERRRKEYLPHQPTRSLHDTIAIVVDDGIATGLTMKAALKSIKARHPQKIIVAVPVAPKSTFRSLSTLADGCIGLETPDDWFFRGAIGAYYNDFSQTEDREVCSLLEENAKHDKN